MSILREKTAAWLKEQKLFRSSTPTVAGFDQTRCAYEARRTADVPFGEYEFALREPIGRKITSGHHGMAKSCQNSGPHLVENISWG